MTSLLRPLFAAIFAVLSVVAPARAAGTLPFALQQQVDTNGKPIIGCLLNIYQVGTTATPQQIYQDFGLTILAPNPLQCDNTGRLPMFWLADGTVHPRLTDAAGVQIIDIPVMQTLGPSAGVGGGGGGTDPTAVASTGDIKFRASAETLGGWVKLNAQTIGSATSGATGRANSDTQNLFVYLWNNCPDAHCGVNSGRGASGLADFSANKTIQLPDLRSRILVGRDTMEGSGAAGRLNAARNFIPIPDTIDTANAVGGENGAHALITAELAQHTHTVTDPGHIHNLNLTDPGHTHGTSDPGHFHAFTGAMGQPGGFNAVGGSNAGGNTITSSATTGVSIVAATTGISGQTASSVTSIGIQNTGLGNPHNIMSGFMLGSFYIKL